MYSRRDFWPIVQSICTLPEVVNLVSSTSMQQSDDVHIQVSNSHVDIMELKHPNWKAPPGVQHSLLESSRVNVSSNVSAMSHSRHSYSECLGNVLK